MGSFGFGGVLRAQGQFIKHNVKPLFGVGGTNTRTKNYLTVGPLKLPWNPRSPKGTQRSRERIGFEEAIHRETGWDGRVHERAG